MKISQIMSPSVVTVSPEESVALAARLMSRHNVGSLPVCGGEGRLRGVVTDRDIVLRCLAAGSDPDITPVKEIMTRRVATVSAGAEAEEAASLMARRRVRRLPVMEGERLVGVVSLGDMAKADGFLSETSAALSEISGNVRRE